MEKIKSFVKKPIALGLAGLLIGAIFGLVVLGWGLWPLKWLDAGPADLQIDYQRDYLCMTIDSYIRNQDNALVLQRWQGLGEKGPDLLGTLTPAVCRFSSDKEIKAFGEVVSSLALAATIDEAQPSEVPGAATGAVTPDVASPEVVTPEVVTQFPAEEPKSGFSIVPLAILMALTLIVGGVFVFLMLKKGKSAGGITAKE